MDTLLVYYLESARSALLRGNTELARYELGTAATLAKRLGNMRTWGRVMSAIAHTRRIASGA